MSIIPLDGVQNAIRLGLVPFEQNITISAGILLRATTLDLKATGFELVNHVFDLLDGIILKITIILSLLVLLTLLCCVFRVYMRKVELVLVRYTLPAENYPSAPNFPPV
jgi:hypothetical protein